MSLNDLVKVWPTQGGGQKLSFWCPGCNMVHAVKIAPDDQGGWDWNESSAYPTLYPAIVVAPANGSQKCRCTVTDGKITYDPGCSHGLKGQTVPMLPLRKWV